MKKRGKNILLRVHFSIVQISQRLDRASFKNPSCNFAEWGAKAHGIKTPRIAKTSSAPTLPSCERKIDENFGVSRGRGAPRHSGLIVAQRPLRSRILPSRLSACQVRRCCFCILFSFFVAERRDAEVVDVVPLPLPIRTAIFQGHFRDLARDAGMTFDRTRCAVPFAHTCRLRQLIGNFRT